MRAGDGGSVEQIRGIGPKLAAELGEMGVATIADVAALSKNDLARIDAKLTTIKAVATATTGWDRPRPSWPADPTIRVPGSGPGARPRQVAEAAATIPRKSAAFRLAPPTSPPSTFETAKISAAFPGLTDPP